MQYERERNDQEVEIGEDLSKSLTHDREDNETEPPSERPSTNDNENSDDKGEE